MRKEIHKVEIGDLVRRSAFHPNNQRAETFLVLDILGDYSGRRDKTHEMTLKLWQVTRRPGRRWDVPMNKYEVISASR